MSFVANTETENQEKLKGTRPQVSSAGKRLFALLIDFIFALLLANTLVQILRREHWDLVMPVSYTHLTLPTICSV